MSEGKSSVEPPHYLKGGKRVQVRKSEWMSGWWVGHGKDDSCQIEGDWSHWVVLAAKILSDPATELVAPNLYRPDLEEAMTNEQRRNYTELSDPVWPSEETPDAQ